MSKLFLDAYDRPARLYPALLVLLPVPVLIICLFGQTKVLATSIVSVLLYCGVSYALARVARNAGKRRQDGLFSKWGGAPTTQLLRHRNAHFDPYTKGRYHALLAIGIGKPFPDATFEAINPYAADQFYRAGTYWLIASTRNVKRFPLIFKENVSFGFHRNALGIRWYGAFVALICLLIALEWTSIFVPVYPYVSLYRLTHGAPSMLLTLGVSVIMLFAWLFWFNEDATKCAAFSYAERLLESCDHLMQPSTGGSSSNGIEDN